MAINQTKVYDEVASRVATVLELPAENVVTTAIKFVRYTPRDLIENLDLGGFGLNPRFVILRTFAQEHADWGMSNYCVYLPISIFFIDSIRNLVNTTAVGDQSDTVIVVDSTEFMFAGQTLEFRTAEEKRVIVSVDSPTEITLESTITVVDGELITSSMQSDIDARMSLLAQEFQPGGFDNFQLVDYPSTDTSDMNEVNIAMQHDGYDLVSGSIHIRPLVGETP